MTESLVRELKKLLKLKPNTTEDATSTILMKRIFEGTPEEVQLLVSFCKKKKMNKNFFSLCNFAQQGATLLERIDVVLRVIRQFHDKEGEQATTTWVYEQEENFDDDSDGGSNVDATIEEQNGGNEDCNLNEDNSNTEVTEENNTNNGEDNSLNEGSNEDNNNEEDSKGVIDFYTTIMALHFIVTEFKITHQTTAKIVKALFNKIVEFGSLATLDPNTAYSAALTFSVLEPIAKNSKNHQLLFKCGLVGIILCSPEDHIVELLALVQPVPTQFALSFAKECMARIRLDTPQRKEWESMLHGTIKNARSILLEARFADFVVKELKETKQGDMALLALYEGQGGKLFSILVNAGFDITDLSYSLKTAVSDFLLQYAKTIMNSRDHNSPWYIPPSLLPPSSTAERKFTLIPGQVQDKSLVDTLYNHHPFQGYEVKSVQILHNEHLSILFSGRINLLEERHSSKVFNPWWSKSGSTKEQQLRTQVITSFNALSRSYARAPHVSFLPLWYSAHPAVIEQLKATGFANLTTLESGQFGKGFYLSTDAEFAFKMFGATTLIVAWAAAYSPFPVIPQDGDFLAGKANHENYDTHFAPTFPNSRHQHTQMVIFESSQMLPHYLVELQPTNGPPSQTPLVPAVPTNEVPCIATIIAPTAKSVDVWSVAEVNAWMSSLALSQQYKDEIAKHNINGRVLSTMKKKDWLKIGVKTAEDVEQLLASTTKLQ